MPLETALPEDLQAQFEQAVCDVISGVSQTEPEVLQEVPPPDSDGSLEYDAVPELEHISVHSFVDNRMLGVDLYFSPIPDGEEPVIPDVLDPMVDHDLPPSAESTDATYLGDLEGPYARLSEAIVDTLTGYCDAPEFEPAKAFLGDRADFLCTAYLSEQHCVFTTYIAYPEYIKDIYANGKWSQARRFGLPY